MRQNDHLTAKLEELAADVRDVGVALREARAQLDDAIKEARQIAVRAYRAGMSEVDIARELHVDRARTLRRWLGKRNRLRPSRNSSSLARLKLT